MKGKSFKEIVKVGEITFYVTGKYSLSDTKYIGTDSKIEFDTIEAKILNDAEEIHFEDARFLLDSFDYFDQFEDDVIDALDEKYFSEEESAFDDIEDEFGDNTDIYNDISDIENEDDDN